MGCFNESLFESLWLHNENGYHAYISLNAHIKTWNKAFGTRMVSDWYKQWIRIESLLFQPGRRLLVSLFLFSFPLSVLYIPQVPRCLGQYYLRLVRSSVHQFARPSATSNACIWTNNFLGVRWRKSCTADYWKWNRRILFSSMGLCKLFCNRVYWNQDFRVS